MTLRQRALMALKDGPKTSVELAKLLDRPKFQIASILKPPRDQGLVIGEPTEAGGKAFVWRLAGTPKPGAKVRTFHVWWEAVRDRMKGEDTWPESAAEEAWEAAMISAAELIEARALEAKGRAFYHPEIDLGQIAQELRGTANETQPAPASLTS